MQCLPTKRRVDAKGHYASIPVPYSSVSDGLGAVSWTIISSLCATISRRYLVVCGFQYIVLEIMRQKSITDNYIVARIKVSTVILSP
jgi:hypothetical protein